MNDDELQLYELNLVCNITTSVKARRSEEKKWCIKNPSECYQFTSASQFGGAFYVSQVHGLRLKNTKTYGSYSPEGGILYATSCPNLEIVDSSLKGKYI